MKTIGTFQSKRWGTVTVLQGNYLRAGGPVAIQLEDANGAPLGKLSVNLAMPEASADSRNLPADCFYVKAYDDVHAELARDALASGLFRERPDLPIAMSGHITAPAWQLASAA